MHLLLAVLLFQAPSPDTTRLTLALAVLRAVRVSPSLEAAEQARAGASGSVREARAQWFPQLNLDGSLFQHEEPMLVAPIHGFTPSREPQFDETLVQGSVGLGWTLYDGGLRRGKVAQARALEAASAAQVDGASQAVTAVVIRTYVEALARREAVVAEDRRGAALAAEADRVARFLAEGRAAPLEQLRVRAAAAAAEADRSAALSGLAVAEAALARLVGMPPDQVRADLLEPVGPAPVDLASRDSLLRLVRAANPAMQAAVSRTVAAQAAVRAAEGTRLPTLRVEGRVVTYGSAAGDYSTEWQTGVRVAFPVFTGGGRGAAIDRARSAAREAEALARDTELALANRLDQAVAAWVESGRRLTALEAAVVQLTEAQRVEALALEQGAGTQSDFLRAEADLARARAGLAQAKAARIGAAAEVAQLTGRLSPAMLPGIAIPER